MRRTICALLTMAAVGVLSLSVDASCAHIPNEYCKGTAVIDKPGPHGEVGDSCNECLEATCCDKVGDCAKNECANEVVAAHKCVLTAGRRAASDEADCETASLHSDQSRDMYACMRSHCGEQCSLPTCKLDPAVPLLGSASCDHCFAQSCCALMNACARNRTCLLGLKCIVEECGPDFSAELRRERHAEAVKRRDDACGDAGGAFADAGGSNNIQNCFLRCIVRTFQLGSADAQEATCLAAQINECGADVDCGSTQCVFPTDASSDAPVNDGPADAPNDAPSDAPKD